VGERGPAMADGSQAHRRPLVAGNWKMNLTHLEGAVLAAEVAAALPSPVPVDVVLCPPFTALQAVGDVLAAAGGEVMLGAQDLHWQERGAFTGEVSAGMLAALGCRYVIAGHSERRGLFGETDEMVARKAAAARAAGLIPIVCVGETLEQRRAGRVEAVILGQLEAVLAAVSPDAGLVIAYEPVWAIGTGEAASPADAAAVARLIRDRLRQAGPGAGDVRILYGGSVTAENAAGFLSEPDLDGALVGGASLDARSFAAIVEAAVKP